MVLSDAKNLRASANYSFVSVVRSRKAVQARNYPGVICDHDWFMCCFKGLTGFMGKATFLRLLSDWISTKSKIFLIKYYAKFIADQSSNHDLVHRYW